MEKGEKHSWTDDQTGLLTENIHVIFRRAKADMYKPKKLKARSGNRAAKLSWSSEVILKQKALLHQKHASGTISARSRVGARSTNKKRRRLAAQRPNPHHPLLQLASMQKNVIAGDMHVLPLGLQFAAMEENVVAGDVDVLPLGLQRAAVEEDVVAGDVDVLPFLLVGDDGGGLDHFGCEGFCFLGEPGRGFGLSVYGIVAECERTHLNDCVGVGLYVIFCGRERKVEGVGRFRVLV